jgi:hypothetical protein
MDDIYYRNKMKNKKNNIKYEILFEDQNKQNRFLFRLINYGDKTDELKFSFNSLNDSKKIIYSEKKELFPEDSIIRDYSEITYHSDGSFLYKFPQTPADNAVKRVNPHGEGSRRTPLKQITDWERVLHGNIIRYQDCPTEQEGDEDIILRNPIVFNGAPFEYYIYLGNKDCPYPFNSSEDEMLFRIRSIGKNLDLIIWFRKSEFYGDLIKDGNLTYVRDLNRIRVIEPKLEVKEGAIFVDIAKLNQAMWYGDVCDDKVNLNIHYLRKIPPGTQICKCYLKNNPIYSQVVEWVGFNKGFAVELLFRGFDLKIREVGILNKDEKGDFIGILSTPSKGANISND